MLKMFRTLLFLSLILAACSSGGPSTEALPPAVITDVPTSDALPIATQEVLPPPKLIATLATPHIEQGPDGAITALQDSDSQSCGYQWAQQDLPDLSNVFQQSLQVLQPEAQAYAFAFGENCVLTDGSIARFIPMETDFNIILQVDDLSNESELGEWIVKVMQVVENIPPDLIVGPRPGRISLTFESNGEKRPVVFYIDQYRALPTGLDATKIFQKLQTQP